MLHHILKNASVILGIGIHWLYRPLDLVNELYTFSFVLSMFNKYITAKYKQYKIVVICSLSLGGSAFLKK